jgi:2-desacetyl-2-hydroxyethyl bacteriochlorophyllide A dehydrogenase
MKRTSLYFVGPQKVELREEQLAAPGAGQVQVRSLVSAISAGTELMIYKGEAPQKLSADTEIAALSGSLAFPLKYGYSMVGQITGLGAGVEPYWTGRRIFVFNPHESAFNTDVNLIQLLPDNCPEEDAVFLANMETAVNLILDGTPRLGEKVVVLGQGVVGLHATALLARHPLAQLITMDGIEMRRDYSQRFGAHATFAPDQSDQVSKMLGDSGADLVYELTGNPEALNIALALVGAHGRIVVGSWYGTRSALINLGEKFHRGRVKIISSQVSQIEPGLRGRWDKARRFEQAWKWLQEIRPSQLLTHRYPFSQAKEAYELSAKSPQTALGVLFHYQGV